VRWLSVFAAVVALSVVAVGCGGGDESASGDTTATETTTDETTTEDTTTDGTTPDLSGVFADEDCLALVAAVASFSQAFAGVTSSSDETTAFQELADKVPDEIAADVQVLAEAYADYAAELQDIGIEAGAAPTAEQLQQLQTALASFDQDAVSEASQRLSTWAQTNCPSG
jgi:hypothetical protein